MNFLADGWARRRSMFTVTHTDISDIIISLSLSVTATYRILQHLLTKPCPDTSKYDN